VTVFNCDPDCRTYSKYTVFTVSSCDEVDLELVIPDGNVDFGFVSFVNDICNHITMYITNT